MLCDSMSNRLRMWSALPMSLMQNYNDLREHLHWQGRWNAPPASSLSDKKGMCWHKAGQKHKHMHVSHLAPSILLAAYAIRCVLLMKEVKECWHERFAWNEFACIFLAEIPGKNRAWKAGKVLTPPVIPPSKPNSAPLMADTMQVKIT